MDLKFETLVKNANGIANTNDLGLLKRAFDLFLKGTGTHVFWAIAVIQYEPRTVALMFPCKLKDRLSVPNVIFRESRNAEEMAQSFQAEITQLLGKPCKYIVPLRDPAEQYWEVYKVTIGHIIAAMVMPTAQQPGMIRHAA